MSTDGTNDGATNLTACMVILMHDYNALLRVFRFLNGVFLVSGALEFSACSTVMHVCSDITKSQRPNLLQMCFVTG